jgi:hypothetical protein
MPVVLVAMPARAAGLRGWPPCAPRCADAIDPIVNQAASAMTTAGIRANVRNLTLRIMDDLLKKGPGTFFRAPYVRGRQSLT